MQKAEIEAKIRELRGELGTVRGSATEVYTRIVGYYRSVKNWNAGKREEYGIRKLFGLPEGEKAPDAEAMKEPVAKPSEGKTTVTAAKPGIDAGHASAYMFFERETCPNCPPVKNFIGELPMSGVRHDVDTEEGLNAARRYGVMASPTVIFFDEKSNEVFRAHNLADLKSKLSGIRA